ncbi:MAG: dual specificity protein phosphatase family protein [Symploca sp. SIO2B6]|nr:dual specificity protein phosphatase family protein [Symploca sp. SIO2B6]
MRQLLSSLSRWNRSEQVEGNGYATLLKPKWVLPGQLALGRHLRDGEEPILYQAGIQTVLSLCDEAEASISPMARHHFHCIRYPLPDSHNPAPLRKQDVTAVLKIVHSSLIHHYPIYVHCLAGMERSPTICIAYLCLYQGYGLWESFNWLKQINPRTMPTDHQLDVVRSLIASQ